MTPPRATYRLQLGPTLTFADVRELVPYFRELGISHLYLSPVLQARRGSTHGYDVVDPRRVSDELGGIDELQTLCDSELEIVLDLVEYLHRIIGPRGKRQAPCDRKLD